MSFKKLIELFRDSGQQLGESGFSYDGVATASIFNLLNHFHDSDDHLFVVTVSEKPSQVGARCKFDCPVPKTGKGAFYKDFDQLLKNKKSIYKGEALKNYYIADAAVDYSDQDLDGEKPVLVANLEKCIDFISELKRFSDKYFESSDSHGLDLVFVSPATIDKPAKTIVVNTTFIKDDLESINVDGSVLKELSERKDSDVLHLEERRSLMRLAIADVLDSKPEDGRAFSYLLKNWQNVLDKYRHNLDVYVNGFSFEKTRKDISKAELDFASSLNSVISDMTGKLLAIPLSFAGVAVFSVETAFTFKYWVLYAGILIVCAVMLLVLYNQVGVRNRIQNSFFIVFDQFKSKLENYPDNIKTPLEAARSGVNRQGDVLRQTIYIFMYLSILPFAVATANLFFVLSGSFIVAGFVFFFVMVVFSLLFQKLIK